MRKVKNLISLAIAFCLIVSSLCTVYADDSTIVWNEVAASGNCTAYKWRIDGTTLYLDYPLPGTSTNNWVTVREYDAAYAERPWQDSAATITEVVITGEATKIGRQTFRDMTALKSVTLSNKIHTIDKWAFNGCTSLGPSFVVPAHVTTLGEDVFMNTNIVSLIFEETETAISIKGLRYLGNLKNITLMRPVTLVDVGSSGIDVKTFFGQYAAGTYGMTNPAQINVLVTDESYFESLADVAAYPETVTVNTSSELGLNVGTFDECTVIDKGQDITFVTDVADKLSHMLYTENNKLTVEILAHNKLGAADITNKTTVTTAKANHDALVNALTDKGSIKKIVLSAGFETTGDYFSVKSDSESTTQLFTNVEEVVLPKTLTGIGNNAFYNMTKLAKVNFEDTKLTSIGAYSFQFCPIETIIMPSTCPNIYGWAFADNPALDTVYLPVTTSSVIRGYSFGATKASEEYAGDNVKVVLDGVYTLGETNTNTFNKNVFQDQNSVVTDYRTTTLIYDSSEWSTAPTSLLDVTAVADKYYDVSDNDGDGKANLFMYSFGTVAQPYKLFAGVYEGTSLSNAIELTEGTYTGSTIVANEYDVAVDTGKTAKVFLWDGFTSLKPLDSSALTID